MKDPSLGRLEVRKIHELHIMVKIILKSYSDTVHEIRSPNGGTKSKEKKKSSRHPKIVNGIIR